MTKLIMDLIVAGLLVLTSSWCALLYRRLQRLRVERSEIETFLAAVDGASRRAEQAIAGIRDSAAETQRKLGAERETIEQRVAELTRLIESAGRMARRVEGLIHEGARTMATEAMTRERARGARPPQAQESPRSPTETRSQPVKDQRARPRIEAELAKLLEALR
jgi:hypothetical protein